MHQDRQENVRDSNDLSLNGDEKEMGNILRLSQRDCGCDFWETPGTSREVKNNFKKKHRLEACYDFSIYIHLPKAFLFFTSPSQLFSALEQLRFDEKVRVVVFKSKVKGVFCAGR